MYQSAIIRYKNLISHIPLEILKQIESDAKINLSSHRRVMLNHRDVCLVFLYCYEQMSADEIKEKYSEFFRNKHGRAITRRGISLCIKKYDLQRKHKLAMSHRIKTGRFDAKKRKFDYEARDKKIYKDLKYAINLNKILKRRGIAQKELAGKVNVSSYCICSWVNYLRRVSGFYQQKLCNILKVKNKDLFSINRPKEHIPKKGDGLWATNLGYYLLIKGKTKQDLANHMKMKSPNVVYWVNLRDRICPENRQKISKFLDVPEGEIFRKNKRAKKKIITPEQIEMSRDAKRTERRRPQNIQY